MENVNQQIKSEIRLWARTQAYFADSTDAGFYVVVTHHTDNINSYAAMSERTGLCECVRLTENPDGLLAPYGRKYVFAFENEEGKMVYLEELSN